MSKRARNRHEPTQRQLRVGEELRHALSHILARQELRDPALVDATVTVTEVRVSPDMRNATVFVMPLAGQHAAEILAALRRSAPFLRGLIAREVPLRYTPALAFELDNSFDHASHINRLLHRPEVERDLAADEGEAGGADKAPGEDQDHGA